MNRLPKQLFVLALMLRLAQAGTVTGVFQTASSGTVANATINFTLSQAAVVSGTASVVASQVSCYTDVNGNVVGVPDALATPAISANLASGTLPAGTYYIKIAYYNASGVGNVSPEAIFNLASQGTLIVNAPTVQPSAATGFKVYISSTSGTETLQATQSSFAAYSQSVVLISGSALPVSNSSACSFRFSDEMMPTGTSYSVNLLNKNGSQIAGYPQTWCTFGGSNGSINISQGAPTGLCNVVYPTPILAAPQNNGTQSISGPLSLGTYGLTAGSTTINSSPAGTSATFPLQSLGNSATPTGIIAGGVNWPSMGFFADFIPSTSTQIETDGVQGILENQSTTTGAVGLRGQAQAGANGTHQWGGNLLCTDYDHALTAYTGTECTGLEIDVNTKSTTTVGGAISVIFGNDTFSTVAPVAAFPVLNAIAKNGGQAFNGVAMNNGLTSSGQAYFAGSQGATGVANKASQYMEFDGANGAGTAVPVFIQATKAGGLVIRATANVGLNLGGTAGSPTEPGQPLDVAGNIRSSGQLMSTVATGTAPLAITSTTPVTTLNAAPIIYNAAGTQQTNGHIVEDSCTLGTNCAVTLTGSAAYTSISSYQCIAVDASATNAVKVAISSGSAFTITGTGTDQIRYTCAGN